ncbi:hypothetical protein TSAR_013336 [Trichomalopsis sarcophagae]|uniref:Uncharacterized protein n=1 Tax=Trichomalopsis sarcophagae TaxID=543379 RepID=A0A232EIJ0_9HYME|nr:hypothetical protein TSAR_013336 [Trichomalopsis sarcophagae]
MNNLTSENKTAIMQIANKIINTLKLKTEKKQIIRTTTTEEKVFKSTLACQGEFNGPLYQTPWQDQGRFQVSVQTIIHGSTSRLFKKTKLGHLMPDLDLTLIRCLTNLPFLQLSLDIIIGLETYLFHYCTEQLGDLPRIDILLKVYIHYLFLVFLDGIVWMGDVNNPAEVALANLVLNFTIITIYGTMIDVAALEKSKKSLGLMLSEVEMLPDRRRTRHHRL